MHAKTIQMGNFSTNGAEYPHARERSWTSSLHNIQKLTQNGPLPKYKT